MGRDGVPPMDRSRSRDDVPASFAGLPSLPQLTVRVPGLEEDPTLCLRCRSAQLLCGKPVCPILVRYGAFARTLPLVDGREVDGSTPPGVFVGRFGWPKVSLGPLVAPMEGDTALLDSPEDWVGRPVEEVVGFRTSLIRGTRRFDVHHAERPDTLIDHVQTIALAAESADIEATFRRAPRGQLSLSDSAPPFGPTAPIEKVKVDVRRLDAHLERSFRDTDANARISVNELYDRGVRVSRIQRAFSAGTLGRGGRRTFVPTRWSITAIDDIVGRQLLEKVRMLPELDEFLLYRYTALDNRWFLAFLPGSFRYESIEAWYPGTLWNPDPKNLVMMGDSEGYDGRTTYASIGGCYYAARLAVSEAMRSMGRQAGAVVLREVHPGEILPLGVWNVREHVRVALKGRPERLAGGLAELAEKIGETFEIPRDRWMRQSRLISDARHQRRLEEYLARPTAAVVTG